jgi:hypothetical protein
MFDDEAISKIVDNLILEGGIEFAGVDPESGEILYSLTPKIKEIMPELYEEHINFINNDLMALWEKGFVDIDFFNDDPLIYISDKSYDKTEVMKLSREERWSLQELKRTIDSQEL